MFTVALKRWVFVFLEILAVVTTIFAFYEIFLARRTVPVFISQDTNNQKEQEQSFRQFLSDNVEKFAYLELQFAFGFNDDSGIEGLIDFGRDNRYQDLGDRNPLSYGGYLVYDSSDFDQAVLSKLLTLEDGLQVNVEGLVFITNKPGEGDNYYHLIPAPFESTTQRIHACTGALVNQVGLRRIVKYFENCVLN